MHGNGNGKLILDKARITTPPVSGVEAMRKQLALAVYGNVNDKDVADMMTKLKEMAMAGDLRAMQMWFKLTVGDGKAAAAAPQEPAGVAALAEAIEDLVDEIRVAKAAPPKSKRLTTENDDE